MSRPKTGARILIYNRTKIPYAVLSELARCSASFVKLPARSRVHLMFTWGKNTHGQARYTRGKKETWLRVRIARGLKQLPGVELAFSVFLVTVHELFHAHEFLTGKLDPSEATASRRRLRWESRPHEQRAVIREGGAGIAVLMNREGARSRRAVRELARALCDLGIVFA